MDAPQSPESGARADSAARDAALEHVLPGLNPRLRTAFAPRSGPLADPDAPPDRQRAMQRLFVDAFVRHGTALAPGEAGQALEGLLLADLLMRELDGTRARLHRTAAIRDHSRAPGGG